MKTMINQVRLFLSINPLLREVENTFAANF